MRSSCTLALLALAQLSLAIPIPQGAGVGAGCDAIFSDLDTGLGELVEEAGDNLATLLRRQGAGVGEGCDYIFSDLDTGLGELVEEAGDNLAQLLQHNARRQLNRIGAGVAAVVNDVDPILATDIYNTADEIDSDGTTDSALIGQQIGSLELLVGEEVGDLVPSKLPTLGRRQLNRIGAGVAAVVNDVDPTLATDIYNTADEIDSDGTTDSALIGQQIGSLELLVGEEVGDLVPSKLPAQ